MLSSAASVPPRLTVACSMSVPLVLHLPPGIVPAHEAKTILPASVTRAVTSERRPPSGSGTGFLEHAVGGAGPAGVGVLLPQGHGVNMAGSAFVLSLRRHSIAVGAWRVADVGAHKGKWGRRGPEPSVAVGEL